MTKQEEEYAAYKAQAGVSGTFNEVKRAALLATTGLSGPITLNELEIAWLQSYLGVSETNISSLKAQAAADQGVARWSDLGSLVENFFSSYLLDTYTGAVAAYSLRQLSSTHTGAVVRVRRSSDSTEQDFTPTEITDGTLETFCGAGDGHVTTGYDQSGNTEDASNATASEQPKIVSSGSLLVDANGKPLMEFAGAELVTNLSLVAQPVTYLVVASTPNSNTEYFFDGGANRQIMRINSSNWNLFAGSSLSGNAATLGWHVHDAVFDGANSDWYVDASQEVSGNAGSNGISGLQIGVASGASAWSGKMQEFVLWGSDLGASRSSLRADVNSHYSIY